MLCGVVTSHTTLDAIPSFPSKDLSKLLGMENWTGNLSVCLSQETSNPGWARTISLHIMFSDVTHH